MSDNPIQRRIPIKRRTKPPHPSPSAHRLHRKVAVRRSSNKQSKLIKRCHSEPALLTAVGAGARDEHQDMTPPGDSCLLFRNRIATDVFSSSPELLLDSPEHIEGYNKDSKVVIKVTIEGSVGPIQALVKLGSSVDETIKLVRKKYNVERRSPRLEKDDMTSFELHDSCYSLQCLDKSNIIGEIGRRSFYMRRVNNNGIVSSTTSIGSEIVVAEAEEAPSSFSNIFVPGFIHQEFKNFINRTSKIRRLLGCFGE